MTCLVNQRWKRPGPTRVDLERERERDLTELVLRSFFVNRSISVVTTGSWPLVVVRAWRYIRGIYICILSLTTRPRGHCGGELAWVDSLDPGEDVALHIADHSMCGVDEVLSSSASS